MPRSTVKYEFEFKVLEWASNFSFRLTDENVEFLILFDSDGAIRGVLFSETSKRFRSESTNSINKSFFYDPFDAPEYTFIQWENLNRKILERIVGHQFSEDDLNTRFSNENRLEEFPNSWKIMF